MTRQSYPDEPEYWRDQNERENEARQRKDRIVFWKYFNERTGKVEISPQTYYATLEEAHEIQRKENERDFYFCRLEREKVPIWSNREIMEELNKCPLE